MDRLHSLGLINTAQVFLPSGAQLRAFPAAVVEDVRSVAISVLRRLFYPILQRYVAGRQRRRTVESILHREEMEDGMMNSLERLSVLSSCIQAADETPEMTEAWLAMKQALKTANFRLFLQREFIQYPGEPSSGVILLLSGTVKKRSLVAKGKGKVSVERIPSRPSTAPASVMQYEESSQTSRASSTTGSGRRGSSFSMPSDHAVAESLLHAPAVFGECAVVGGYPCTEYMVADSSFVLTAWLSRNAYCTLLEAFPKGVQKRLLLKALESRGKLLPQFAPMTCGRMRICPLLAGLSDENLQHLMDYLIPQVRPAGMQIGELGVPEHIFFVRRGVVHLQQDEGFVADLSAPTQPKSRSLLLEGHTFGERQCIFREALGDTMHTVTNVDLYLLPFSVLIQFMKQEPDARTSIFSSAKAASLLLEKEYRGMRFIPFTVDHIGTILLRSARLSKWFNRRVSISTACSTRATPFGALRLDGEHLNGTENGDAYGVSPHFLEQVRKIPLLNLCSPDDAFYKDCARRWRMLSYEPGDYIVRRGADCNRLLLFTQRGASVLLDENAVKPDARGGILSLTELDLPRVPQGSIVGYTCVRRHPWTHSIVAVDGQIEVWELRRATFVDLLRKHQLERKMQEVVLQILQPLMQNPGRSVALDYQPLLAPSPNSLWSEHRIPNMHPVSTCEYLRFPVWKEGDLPPDSRNLRSRPSVSSHSLSAQESRQMWT
ncbi:hypothetical protein DQ04_08771010 [Trypanosoma grayi]|uniref:hypothetical protein n=1 Tax=Trypanosoma grayi TaxID=71804 RepID=UPI0004F41C5C|nr:hypothetical protein DQ04_08771010 [Trypanosoma grayi]KEG07808.1 hypothetical protein DQ04_08771010 [Trypanosoma grayi]